MAIHISPADDDEDGVLAAINTTPLVDVMLVLLIIFLITVPVMTRALPVALPGQTARPAPPDKAAVTITVDRDGGMFWDDAPLADAGDLAEHLRLLAARTPPPPLRIRGDRNARFAAIGRVVAACHRAGIAAVGFATQPAGKSDGK